MVRVRPQLGHLAGQRLECGVAAAGPGLKAGEQAASGCGRDVAQRGDAVDLHERVLGVELGFDEPRVDGADYQLFEGLPAGEVERLLERRVAERWGAGIVWGVVVLPCECEKGELAELETLGIAEGGEAGGGGVRRVCAIAEDLEEG